MKYFFVQSFFIQRIHAVSKIDLLSAYCNTYNNRSIYYKSPLQYAFSYFGSVLHKSPPPQSDISFSSVKLWRKCSEKQVYISTSKISEFSIFGLFIPPWNKKNSFGVFLTLERWFGSIYYSVFLIFLAKSSGSWQVKPLGLVGGACMWYRSLGARSRDSGHTELRAAW